MFGSRICDRLNDLAIRGYRTIHANKGSFGEGIVRFWGVTFPRCFRREWKLFLVSFLAFAVPFFGMFFAAKYQMDWVQAILGPSGMESMEGMYGKNADTMDHLRGKYGSDFMMFAHYINNNVGIDFKLYAGGLLYGIGTLFFLVFNGLHIGAAAGYANEVCDPEKFWGFVSGHSSFELLGMIVVGMAGLKIGFALLAPGQLSRGQALGKAARDSLPLLIGGALMTGLAAVVEGFWSAEKVAAVTKYWVGIFFWVVHVAYFLFVGRGYRGA